jgi:hypothetical protein
LILFKVISTKNETKKKEKKEEEEEKKRITFSIETDN